jgi:hypothetical protein
VDSGPLKAKSTGSCIYTRNRPEKLLAIPSISDTGTNATDYLRSSRNVWESRRTREVSLPWTGLRRSFRAQQKPSNPNLHPAFQIASPILLSTLGCVSLTSQRSTLMVTPSFRLTSTSLRPWISSRTRPLRCPNKQRSVKMNLSLYHEAVSEW